MGPSSMSLECGRNLEDPVDIQVNMLTPLPSICIVSSTVGIFMSVDCAFNQVVASREKLKSWCRGRFQKPLQHHHLCSESIHTSGSSFGQQYVVSLNAQRQTSDTILQNVSLDHYCSLRSGCGHIQRPFSSPSLPKHLQWFKPRVHPKQDKKINEIKMSHQK